MTKKYRVEQIAPELPLTWGTTECFYWNQELNDILKRDVNNTLFDAAHNAVNWEKIYERLKGTPFYDWAEIGCGILTFGGPAHIEENSFFSAIGDITMVHENYLKEHLDFNQVLHDLHVEAAEQLIDFLLQHAPEE